MQKKAVILFSGGLDSTTCLSIAKAEGYDCYALSFQYGQKHSIELEHAKKIAKKMEVADHKIITLSLDQFGGSSLLDQNAVIEDYAGNDKIPSTYVPARNTIFLAMALGWAEVIGAYNIFIGANDVDYSGYPDCRPEYFHAFETLARLATKAGVEEDISFWIRAPLLRLKKKDIIKEGIALGVDYSMTVSCYRIDKEGRACRSCDSCFYRKKGFEEAGISDPTRYQNETL